MCQENSSQSLSSRKLAGRLRSGIPAGRSPSAMRSDQEDKSRVQQSPSNDVTFFSVEIFFSKVLAFFACLFVLVLFDFLL